MGQNGPHNIDYSIYEHTFFCHNLAIFCSIGLNFFLWQLRRLLSYYLSICDKKSLLWWFFEKILFLAGKWAWQPRRPQRVWGLSTRSKSWPTGWTFWVNRYLENLFSKISAWTCFQKVEIQLNTGLFSLRLYRIHDRIKSFEDYLVKLYASENGKIDIKIRGGPKSVITFL